MPYPPADRLLTAEELYRYPDTGTTKYELERGRLVVSEPPGERHGSIALNIGAALLAFVRPRRLGVVTLEAGCVLRRNPDTVRGPDVTFVRQEHLDPGRDRDKFLEGAPDFAVEVISPGERPGAVARKIAGYFEGGAALVWAVYPARRLVVVHTPDGTTRVVREPESLDGGEVLPGFALPAAAVFAET